MGIRIIFEYSGVLIKKEYPSVLLAKPIPIFTSLKSMNSMPNSPIDPNYISLDAVLFLHLK